MASESLSWLVALALVILGVLVIFGVVRARQHARTTEEPPDDRHAQGSGRVGTAQSAARSQDTGEAATALDRAIGKGPSSRVFISYRRDDAPDTAGRIFDRLAAEFGPAAVFKDVDSIPLGVDFRVYLDQAVGACNVMLVLIGPRWLTTEASGERRLDMPNDFVRLEIEAALRRDVPIIPMLALGARIPHEHELPETIRGLTYRNGLPVRTDPDFHRDMERVIAAISEAVHGIGG